MESSDGLVVRFANDGVNSEQRESLDDPIDEGRHLFAVFWRARPVSSPLLMVGETGCDRLRVEQYSVVTTADIRLI